MVSVIVPNYCHEPYLKERLDSILSQTYEDFELIILDDCSNDRSRDVIEQYSSNPHVSHIVYNEKNSGSTFIQWERGFELARGRYIWIAESDDVARPTFLEECVRALDESRDGKSPVLAFTDCEYIDSHGKFLHATRLSRELAGRRRGGVTRFGSRFFLTQRLMYQNYILNASMAVFRKDAIPKEREYASYRYVGDWLFWLGVTMNGDVAYIDKPLDGFRQHGDNTTAKSTRGGRNFDEIQRILKYMLPRLGMPAGYAAFMYGKFFIRINRHKRSNPDFNDVYRRWTADAPHPRLCIMWYRVAKLLGIYKHSH